MSSEDHLFGVLSKSDRKKLCLACDQLRAAAARVWAAREKGPGPWVDSELKDREDALRFAAKILEILSDEKDADKEEEPDQYLVWWLTEEDYLGYRPNQDRRNPLVIPDYAWPEFCDMAGRARRGRLWVPEHIPVNGLIVAENNPRWTAELLRSGGIVIESRHADQCARWGGRITTLSLDPVDAQNTEDRRASQTND